MRAAAAGLAQRHRRMHAERARLVAGRRHDPPPSRPGRRRRSPACRAARGGRAARPPRRTRRGRRGGSSGRSRALSSPRCGTPLPAAAPGRRRRRPRAVALILAAPSSPRRSGRVDRPRLAVPVRRPGLGRRPPRRPGPARAGAVGVAMVVSVYLSAHLVTSSRGSSASTGRPSSSAAVLIAVGDGRLSGVPPPWLAPLVRPSLAGIRATLRDRRGAWLVAAAIGAIACS